MATIERIGAEAIEKASPQRRKGAKLRKEKPDSPVRVYEADLHFAPSGHALNQWIPAFAGMTK